MIKSVIQIGDSRLRFKSVNILIKDITSKSIQNLIKDLRDTMHHTGLIGIAAPQIGINKRIFITEIRKTKTRSKALTDQLRVFINPKIIAKSKRQTILNEGCGSICHGQIFGPVKRPSSISIKAYNEKGETFMLKASGLLAKCIQQEYDHIHGELIIDKFVNTKKVFFREK